MHSLPELCNVAAVAQLERQLTQNIIVHFALFCQLPLYDQLLFPQEMGLHRSSETCTHRIMTWSLTVRKSKL